MKPSSPEAKGIERHFAELDADERRAQREDEASMISAISRQRSERLNLENGRRILEAAKARTKKEKRLDKFSGFRDEGDERIEPEFT